MSKAIKQKLKERRQQRALSAENVTDFATERSSCFEGVSSTETLCEASAWDMDCRNSDEQSEFDQYAEPESMESIISCESSSAEKARENLRSKLVAMRHKSNPSVPAEKLSDYFASLNARDTVSPPILVQDGVPDNVQECTLSEPGNPPPPAPILKKAPKTQSIVGMTRELKKRVSIISYGNALYYHNGHYYAYLDAEHLIRLAALIFGRELVIHKIVTDKQVLSDLIDKEELFWTRHVVPQIPPAPNGCDSDTQKINQLYEVDDRDKTADLSALHGLLDKRQELSNQIEQLEQEKTAIEQQVKLKMQDAAYGTAPGYKVSWVSSESKRVDSQRLRKEQPDIFNQYIKNVSSRRFTIVPAA